MNKKIKFKLFFVLIIGLNISLHSQQPVFKAFDIRTENTRPRIVKLMTDHNGRIWVGTDKGVFTFDGINFHKMYSPDTGSSFVTAIYEDKSSNVWAGFENGKIIHIKNQNVTPLQITDSVSQPQISSFGEDEKGRIFYSTKGLGIFYIENGVQKNINQDDGLSDDYCYAMVKLNDNRFCIGTDAGLNFVSISEGKKIIKGFGTSDGLPDDIVRALVLDKNNMLWIGFQEKGLAKFDCNKNSLVPVNLKGDWKYGQINNMVIEGGKLWVATEDKGIVIVDGQGFMTNLELGTERNIKANDMLVDFENNVWIAESIHLFRTSGSKISFFSEIEGKKLQFIHCIASDKKGDIWFSPDQQLGYIFRGEDGKYRYKEYKILDKFIDIVSLYFDEYDYLWIGTLGAGVYRFNPKNAHLRKVTETSNITNSSILSINGDGNTIWVAGFNSVMKLIIRSNGNSDHAVIESVPAFKDSPLQGDYVYSVFIDSKKRTWFATDGSGVYSYDGSALKNIPVTDNVVHSFTEDKSGRIWYSTADAGLEFVDLDQTIHRFQTNEGLSDPSPTSLIKTNEGNIVVVHANGFDVLNPETKAIIYHSSEENLSDLNCDLNAVTFSPDKSIWIGTERGILHYVSSSDIPPKGPKIVLKSVSVFLETIDFNSKKIYEADENNFRFDFDGLWYSDPQRVNYAFLLDAYSTKWETTKDHTVTFPKLPPGKYTFRVKGSLNGNYKDSQESSYDFEILPPVWQRWWFRLGTAAIIAMTVLFMIRRRDARLRKFDKIQKEKIEFQFETLKSQINPHFLFNSFNTLISVIENTPKNALEYVEKLSEFFRNIVTYRDKNLIRVSEELSLLDNYLFIQKKRFGENLKIIVSLDDSVRNYTCIAPLTLQLLFENAIKHNAVSRETPLKVTITSQNEKLVISNNINPKITQERSTGLGLQNIKSRYELLSNVKIEVLNKENTFTVKIPLIPFRHEHTDH